MTSSPTSAIEAGMHTPGPWTTNGDGIVRHHGPAGVLGIKLASPWVEDAWCGDDADAETLANARLIAAAPDLLEALRETWRVIDTAGLQNLTNGVQLGQTVWFVKASDAQAQSEAAITRATAPSPLAGGAS